MCHLDLVHLGDFCQSTCRLGLLAFEALVIQSVCALLNNRGLHSVQPPSYFMWVSVSSFSERNTGGNQTEGCLSFTHQVPWLVCLTIGFDNVTISMVRLRSPFSEKGL